MPRAEEGKVDYIYWEMMRTFVHHSSYMFSNFGRSAGSQGIFLVRVGIHITAAGCCYVFAGTHSAPDQNKRR